MGTIELPSNHKRVISVTAKTVEEELNELEALLSAKKNDGSIKKIIPSYSDKERKFLIEKIGELRKLNHRMFEDLNLDSTELTEIQMVRGKITYLWTVLIDSKSKALKGYGMLPENLATVLDNHLDHLLEIINKLK
jgi:hypothetical protein